MLPDIPQNLIVPLLIFLVLLASLMGGIFRMMFVFMIGYRAARWIIPMTAGAGLAQLWFFL